MARTILEIAQEAAERDATAPAPTSLFSSNTRISKILRAAANDTMREYLRKCSVQGLSELQSTWAFSLVPGRFAYQLPPDFLRMIVNTEHRGGWPMGLIGPATPQAWANWIFGGAAEPAQMGWRIRNNAIWIDPTPTAHELVTIDYITKYPVVSLINDGDYDMAAIPPKCIAPVVPRDGYVDLPSELEITEWIEDQGTWDEPPGWDAAVFGEEQSEVLRRINPLTGVAPLAQVRRPAFVADDDKPAFEDDFLLSLGMTFRLRRALGLDYAEIAAEYEEEMEKKAATDGGGPRSFRLGHSARCNDIEPLGGGNWMVT